MRAPHLIHHLPQEVQWDLYLAVCEVWNTGAVPEEWLRSRITLIYKKGDPRLALNYRPISVSPAMYTVLTKLVRIALHDPIDASLSEWQAGARKGRTTTGQAIALWANLASSGAPRYVCYLDIAKAFPSAPHRSLLRALQALAAPVQLLQIVKSIYEGSWNICDTPDGPINYKLRRGIKEGCPLSPALFMLLYEAFHGTLRHEFPDAQFYVYVDDGAIVT